MQLTKNTFLSTAEERGWPDPCEDYNCYNGGRCVFPYDLAFCICPSGFGGHHCDYSVPIKNGTCPENPKNDRFHKRCDGDYDCQFAQKCCSTDYERLCVDPVGQPNPCAYSDCKNGGSCGLIYDTPICICPSGFGGNYCEYSVPVKNGTCPEIPNDAACTQSCGIDNDCPDTQKCCHSTDCWNMCVEAV
ncbi:hypothetical protein BsWGS_12040 [Bradybaena similaris]